MDKTVCELFAGVGGFRLGLEKSSPQWNTVWFSQWEPSTKTQWAHGCYVNHWGDIDENTGKDIATVNKTRIPDHTLLVGGFPCQNYSVAASKSSKGIEGEKGVLWWQIRDTIIAKRPPFVLLENVDRLLKSPASQRGKDFGIMLTCLIQLGYSVEWRIINAADYGAGQRRRRVFIFAYDNKTEYGKKMSNRNLEDIIIKDGFFAKIFPVAEHESFSENTLPYTDISSVDSEVLLKDGDYKADMDLLEVSNNYKFDFKNAGIIHEGQIVTAEVKPKKENYIPLGELLESGVDSKYYISKEKLYYTAEDVTRSDETEDELSKENRQTWQYVKGGKKRKRKSKNGHEYVFSEGPISMIDEPELPARTMLTSEGGFNRSTHIVRDKNTGNIRLLTPIEAERIQGFDDDWTKYSIINGERVQMPDRNRYFCMGNALVVPMVKRMADYLNTIIDNEK